MSQESQLEQGNGGQLRGESRDEICSGFKSYLSYIPEVLKDICELLIVLLVFLLSPMTYTGYLSGGYILLLCVIGIIVDPLFFYIPLLNDDKKCIVLDKDLSITATVLRSFFDFLKLFYIISVLRTELREIHEKNCEIRKKQREKYGEKDQPIVPQSSFRPWVYFFVDILVILPIPQVLVIFGRMGTKYLFAMTFVLLQYLLRVIRTYHLSTKAESTWVIVGFNLLLYLHGSQPFRYLEPYGTFMPLKKPLDAGRKPCINHTGCAHTSLDCDDSTGDYSFLNDFCNIKTGNSTNYDFGLFEDALQSGIVEMTDFWQKFINSLRWGLQNLSAFGQNLGTSTDIWENIFAILITCYGVLLFIFLILKMQADTKRSQHIRQKRRELRRWPGSYLVYDEDIGKKIKEYMAQKEIEEYMHKTERVNVDSFLRSLPSSLGRKIKLNIGIKLLKNVKEFEKYEDEWLNALCARLNPVFLAKGTRIVREGDPIDEMLFVLTGRLWTYTSKNVTTVSLKTGLCRRRDRYYLQEYDSEDVKWEEYIRWRKNENEMFGEELIPWAQKDSSLDLPISTVTIQALTDVDAFALLAGDLKEFFAQIPN